MYLFAVHGAAEHKLVEESVNLPYPVANVAIATL